MMMMKNKEIKSNKQTRKSRERERERERETQYFAINNKGFLGIGWGAVIRIGWVRVGGL
jgi:hypothetical protein